MDGLDARVARQCLTSASRSDEGTGVDVDAGEQTELRSAFDGWGQRSRCQDGHTHLACMPPSC